MFSSNFRNYYWEDNFVLAGDLLHILKLITKKIYQGMRNLFKVDNKDINKERDQDMFIVYQEDTWKKSYTCYNLVIKKAVSTVNF